MKKTKRPTKASIPNAFAAPSTPADVPTREVCHLTTLIDQALTRIPEVHLTRQQRGALDSHLFSGHRLVAYEVTRAVQQDRELFPEVTDPAVINGGFQRASAWISLASAALLLAQRAAANGLLEEGTSSFCALQILHHVRASTSCPFPIGSPDLPARRAQSMRLAEETLAHARRHHGRRRPPKDTTPRSKKKNG